MKHILDYQEEFVFVFVTMYHCTLMAQRYSLINTFTTEIHNFYHNIDLYPNANHLMIHHLPALNKMLSVPSS